jgi:hypothetical protein
MPGQIAGLHPAADRVVDSGVVAVCFCNVNMKSKDNSFQDFPAA